MISNPSIPWCAGKWRCWGCGAQHHTGYRSGRLRGHGGCGGAGDLFRQSQDISQVLSQYETLRRDRVRDTVLKARKRCDVTHGKDRALTEAWYQELKAGTGERIINGLCETIQGGPLG